MAPLRSRSKRRGKLPVGTSFVSNGPGEMGGVLPPRYRIGKKVNGPEAGPPMGEDAKRRKSPVVSTGNEGAMRVAKIKPPAKDQPIGYGGSIVGPDGSVSQGGGRRRKKKRGGGGGDKPLGRGGSIVGGN